MWEWDSFQLQQQTGLHCTGFSQAPQREYGQISCSITAPGFLCNLPSPSRQAGFWVSKTSKLQCMNILYAYGALLDVSLTFVAFEALTSSSPGWSGGWTGASELDRSSNWLPLNPMAGPIPNLGGRWGLSSHGTGGSSSLEHDADDGPMMMEGINLHYPIPGKFWLNPSASVARFSRWCCLYSVHGALPQLFLRRGSWEEHLPFRSQGDHTGEFP